MKEDKILLANIHDKIHKCKKFNKVMKSDFLDLHQRAIIESKYHGEEQGCNILFFGGYDEAERVCCFVVPRYENIDQVHGLKILRVTQNSFNQKLNHRDYLGSLMSIGIKRDKIGDIIVTEKGADIVIAEKMGEFLSLNYDKAGRTSLNLEIIPIDKIRVLENRYDDIGASVASLRLDNCISGAFNMSRSKAVEAIKKRIVFLNNMECSRIDKEVRLGDKIVLRGKGKVYLIDIGRKSRKDKVHLTFRAYK